MPKSCVARQPIYDARLNRVGYELLYRPSGADTASVGDGREASALVIVNTFIHIGFDNLVGSARAFINIPAELVVDEALLPMFHEHTVLELSADVQPGSQVLAGVRRLKERGFGIALDNFEPRPELGPLLGLADYAKIDVLNRSQEEVARALEALRGTRVQPIALRVETGAALARCRMLGFALFQGYFFCRPQILDDRRPRANRAVVLQLLQRLSDPDLDLSELEATLSGDVMLSYKLMRYVNSAAFGLRREVNSLRDAIVLVGVNTIRNWASLLLFDSVRSDKPQELVRVAMVRATMCEKLVRVAHPSLRGQGFITGLFSVIDALMDTPMVDLLDDLALSAEAKLALLDQAGELGTVLRQTLDYEAGEWSALPTSKAELDILTTAYREAVLWADENVQHLFG
jgi:EAL and modified HD-GYP domain-containing signal transduction protein